MRTIAAEHVDVVIVGAGLSGIGAACHLRRVCPDRTFAILESRGATGGTWDLFRYPGVRSDSDMQTLGYAFAPWKDDKSLADGSSILGYVRRTATEYGVDQAVRLHHRVTAAAWDSETSRWTVQIDRTDTGETTQLTCSFLLTCCGYYDYDGGHIPELPGVQRFAGQLVHPQRWPEDLDYADRRVVVIGSGATAVTLVPAMARDAAHVTMLQRSPSYIVAMPAVDPVAKLLRRLLPEMAAYQLVRWKNVLLMGLSYQLSRRRPRLMKAVIRRGAMRALPAGYDIDTHFRPRYDPWDERLCVVPDGDLFGAVRDGSATVVTDTIDTFTERGIRLRSGTELPADIVVTATGLKLLALGGMDLIVDGEPVHLPDRLAYRGMMLSDVPNFALTIGYTNASWTLKADLTASYVCRLLNHMRAHDYEVCVVPTDPAVERLPLIDLQSGYVKRAIEDFPSQGATLPWRVRQNYPRDRWDFQRADVEDGVMRFARGGKATAAAPPAVTASV